jgi:hypothetical protein
MSNQDDDCAQTGVPLTHAHDTPTEGYPADKVHLPAAPIPTPVDMDGQVKALLARMPADWNGALYFQQVAHITRLFITKNADYAGTDAPDAFANFRKSEDLGIPIVKGILQRANDKWSRLCTLIRENRPGHAADETILDTMRDMANYLLIACAAYLDAEQTQDKGSK